MEISEPWDFKTKTGGKKFKVKFIKVMADKDKNYFLLKTVKPFNWRDKKIDYLIVQARYQGETVKDIFNKPNELIVGIYRLINLKCIDMETFQASDVDYFAIGSISLLKK